MRPHKSLLSAGYLSITIVPLLAAFFIIVVLLSANRTALAQPINPGAGPNEPPGSAPQQVAPENDASLGGLTLTVDGNTVPPNPAFDSETTRYHATVDADSVDVSAYATQSDATIDQITVGDETTVLDSPDNLLSTTVDLVEGAITQLSIRVVAEDGVSTLLYHIDFSRPAADTVPDITITPNRSEYVAGVSFLGFTLTREGDTANSLDVTVRISQDQPWLSNTAHTATFAAGDAETSLILAAADFSSSVTQSGDLVATLAPVDGYDTSGARAVVKVFSQEGPAVTVALEHTEYTFNEDVGNATVALVASAAPGLPYVPDFDVAVITADQSATAGEFADYIAVSSMLRFETSDFEEDGGSLVARLETTVTIVDDDVHEGDELFHLHLAPPPGVTEEVAILDAAGNRCGITCTDPYTINITDNDPAPAITMTASEDYLVGWGDLRFAFTRTGDLTDSLDITVNIEQTQTWLSTTSYTVSFAANDDFAPLVLTPGNFSSTVTESGEITATVAPVDGYDTSDATATVAVHPHDGSLTVRVSLDSPSYTFAEDAGEVNIQVVARPEVNLPYVPTFFVSVSTTPGTAASPGDYAALSDTVSVTNADFALENGQQVARVNMPVTIVDDSTYEGDEMFSLVLEKSPGTPTNIILVDPEGNDCDTNCVLPYPVTIVDNDLPPAITLGASNTDYVPVFEPLLFTLTRTGDTADSLDVTLSLVQTENWLSTTSHTVTFPADEATVTRSIAAVQFSTDVTQSGDLTATVAPVDGYDTSSATATVRVFSQEGPAIRVSIQHAEYTFAEDAGEVELPVVARVVQGIPYIPAFPASVSSDAIQADSETGDYLPLLEMVVFEPADFALEFGEMVARKTVFLTILDDKVFEGDEYLFIHLERSPGVSTEVIALDAQGDDGNADCTNPYRVTILDNDEEPRFQLSAGGDHLRESHGTNSAIEIAIESANGSAYGHEQTLTVQFAGTAVLGQDFTVIPLDEDDQTPGHQVALEAATSRVGLYLSAIDDTVHDPCEWIGMSLAIDTAVDRSGPQAILTIVDNDPPPDGIMPLSVGLTGQRTGEISPDTPDSRSWYSFDATGGERYIIEVKHPLGAGGPYLPAAGGHVLQLPGYLVDPSILEVVDDQDTQVLGEHDQGGFSLNFARAFFNPEDSGTYRIAVGRGPEDRTAYGCYTISVRIDDHADDYRTDPNVVLLPGESITARIDSDVATNDAGLNSWDWASFLESAIPRRGIESLDDRDVFRFRISDAGTYRLYITDQPTGVGIWYVWDYRGNLFERYDSSPVASAANHYDAGTYFVEIGTPYESEGNTGQYTLTLEQVQ